MLKMSVVVSVVDIYFAVFCYIFVFCNEKKKRPKVSVLSDVFVGLGGEI